MTSPAATLRIVAGHFGVSVEKVLRRSRDSETVKMRQIAALVLRETGLSLPAVARAIGWSDHTSAMSAVERARERATSDPDFAATVAHLVGCVRTGEDGDKPEYAPPGSRKAILAEATRLGEMRDRLLALAEGMR